MTAQISDKIRYHDREYSIVGWEGTAPFDPASHGLQPVMFSTGCWQGYYCVYEVVTASPVGAGTLAPAAVGAAGSASADAAGSAQGGEPASGPTLALRLATLFIGLGAEQRTAAEAGTGPLLFGARPAYFESYGCYVYEGLAARMPYSGCLTLGADFIWDQYVHMGFHPPWKYRDVLDLTFDTGRLVKAVDRSDDMAQLRTAVEKGGSPFSMLGVLAPPA